MMPAFNEMVDLLDQKVQKTRFTATDVFKQQYGSDGSKRFALDLVGMHFDGIFEMVGQYNRDRKLEALVLSLLNASNKAKETALIKTRSAVEDRKSVV